MRFSLTTIALFALGGLTSALPNPGETTPAGYGETTKKTTTTKEATCTKSTGYSYSTGYTTYSTVKTVKVPTTTYKTVRLLFLCQQHYANTGANLL